MEFIEPKKVPQRTLYDGGKMPCIGMGTFGSDRFTPRTSFSGGFGSYTGGLPYV